MADDGTQVKMRARDTPGNAVGASRGERVRSGLVVAWTYVHRIYRSYDEHRCALMACACAYCAMLSLIPLLVVGIAGLGFFLGGNEASTRHIVNALKSYAPNNNGFAAAVQSTLEHVLRDRHMLGVFGILGLIWAAQQVFLSMQQAMNVIHGVPEDRTWMRQHLIAVGSGFGTIVVLAGNIAVVATFARLSSYVGVTTHSHVHILFSVISAVVPTLLLWYLFAAMYSALPACHVSHRRSLIGAGVAAVLWHSSLIGFSVYLQHYHSYDRLYGPLAGLAILVVWCYYSMAILLLGAEITADSRNVAVKKQQITDPTTPVEPSNIYNATVSEPEQGKV